MKKYNIAALMLVLAVFICGGWIQNQRINLDSQVTLALTDTTETSLVAAAGNTASIVTTLMISSNTEQSITIKTGTTTRQIYYIPANGPGYLSTTDGVIVYGAAGEAITVTCSAASHTTCVYARYRYQ